MSAPPKATAVSSSAAWRTTAANAGSALSPNAPLNSAIYEGIVRHRRYSPHPHSFRYRIAQLYLDLDELNQVFTNRWLWSAEHPNLAEFRRSDFFGSPHIPLTEAVRSAVERETGLRPLGPIRLLAHLRYAGYSFNPVSFYYCYASDGTTLECILAEITNTPWRERHAYVLPVDSARVDGPTLHWQFEKSFHVSPFLPMNRNYQWSFAPPASRLNVHMEVLNGSTREFDATLTLQRRPLNGASLSRVLWRYPFMTGQVIGAIYWQAIWLRLKGNPAHPHSLTPRGQS